MQQERIPPKSWFENKLDYMKKVTKEAKYHPDKHDLKNFVNEEEDFCFYKKGFEHYRMKTKALKLRSEMNVVSKRYKSEIKEIKRNKKL